MWIVFAWRERVCVCLLVFINLDLNELEKCAGERERREGGKCGHHADQLWCTARAEWTEAEEDQGDAQQWDTSWDDDSVEDNFSKQLR